MCVDYDPPEVWRQETRRARKPHRCLECGRTIEAGETYEVCAGLAEGHWYGGKTCVQCIAARDWLLRVCNGCSVGGVLDELRDHIGEYFYWWDDKALVVLVERGCRQWQRHGRRMAPDEVARLSKRSSQMWLDAGLEAA